MNDPFRKQGAPLPPFKSPGEANESVTQELRRLLEFERHMRRDDADAERAGTHKMLALLKAIFFLLIGAWILAIWLIVHGGQ